MKKILLNMILVLGVFILSGCSSQGNTNYEKDMTKYTNGYCWINLLDANSYYQNGDKIVLVLNSFLEGKDEIYKVKINEKILGTDYYSQTVEEWNYNWYYGNLKDGKPNGYGILLNSNEEIEYIGEFDKGKIKGYGVYFYNGAFYNHNINRLIEFEGNIKKADGLVNVDDLIKADGKAVIPYSLVEVDREYYLDLSNENLSEDGLWAIRVIPRYIGTIKKNRLNGKGTEYFPDGSIKYEGEFKNSYYHGKGTLYYENGQVRYEGEFKIGSFHGKGTLYYENGEVEYKGKFKNGDAA